MRKIVYSMMVSLDGFIEGPDPELDWSVVDDELHAFVNEQVRESGGFVFGRRVYSVMAGYWDDAGVRESGPEVERDYARIWADTPKMVYSRTLQQVGPNTTVLSTVDADEVQRWKQEPGGDLQLSGTQVAAAFELHELIDEYRLFVHPVLLGDGKRFFAPLATWRKLQLLETKQFGSGVLYLRYAPAS